MPSRNVGQLKVQTDIVDVPTAAGAHPVAVIEKPIRQPLRLAHLGSVRAVVDDLDHLECGPGIPHLEPAEILQVDVAVLVQVETGAVLVDRHVWPSGTGRELFVVIHIDLPA